MGRLRRRAFTLVELLVAVGIIAVLVAVLMPALSAARRSAAEVQCASNERQLCVALIAYAGVNRGRFPPNTNTYDGETRTSTSDLWLEKHIIGPFVQGAGYDDGQEHGFWSRGYLGGVFVCPRDEGAARTYAMNLYASGRSGDWRGMTPGPFQGPHVREGWKTILVVESLSVVPGTDGWVAYPTVGIFNPGMFTPGQWFGGNGGVLSTWTSTSRWLTTSTALSYMNHRRPGDGGTGPQPRGRFNIGYCDGHVAMKRHTDLYDAAGRSTFDSLWSPEDYRIERPAPPPPAQ